MPVVVTKGKPAPTDTGACAGVHASWEPLHAVSEAQPSPAAKALMHACGAKQCQRQAMWPSAMGARAAATFPWALCIMQRRMGGAAASHVAARHAAAMIGRIGG